MKQLVNRCVFGVFILLTAASLASAQATASLNGRVTDESGGVLPGVTVTVTQTDTGFARSVVTGTPGSGWRRTCRPVRTGSRSRCRDSRPTCRPASFCR